MKESQKEVDRLKTAGRKMIEELRKESKQAPEALKTKEQEHQIALLDCKATFDGLETSRAEAESYKTKLDDVEEKLTKITNCTNAPAISEDCRS